MPIWSAEIKELEALYSSLKGQLPELEKELEHLIKTDDENVALLYSRRCLEVIITDLCECELKRPRKTEPLKGIIDKLKHEEKVPSHIIASMLNLNSLSTFGAHPKEFDPEQVKPVLSNLNIIIKWYLKYKTQKVESAVKEKEEEHEAEKQKKAEEPATVVKPKNKTVLVVSGIVLIGVILIIALDLFNIFRKDKFEDIRDADGRISIAVMPFENLTGDTTLNWFQRGVSSLIINGLGTSSELAVRDDHTMFEVMESMDQVYTAAVSPSLAKEVAEKVKAETYIRGSFQGREGQYRIMANLVNTQTGDIIWTHKVEGNLKSSGYLSLADSLCNEIKDYLEIKALEQVTDYDFREAYTKSAEAYRFFIEGMNSILIRDEESAIQSLKKALEIDSSFAFASFYIAWSYCYGDLGWEECVIWTRKAYNIKDRLPSKYKPWLELWYACYISEDLQDIIRYLNLLEKSDIESRLLWFDLGVTYYDFPKQYEKAVEAFEKVEEISLERGGDWEYILFYDWYGRALHEAGKYEKEKEIYETGLRLFPAGKDIQWTTCDYIKWRQGVCAFSRGDTSEGNKSIKWYGLRLKELGYSESLTEWGTGLMYDEANIMDKAEVHYRNAVKLEPENSYRIANLAEFLITNDINIDEGMELIEKALETEPENWYRLMIKGWGCYKQGKYEEAIQLLRKAEEISIGFNYDLHQQILEVEQALAGKNKQ
ncbi:MAG: hypothetical protein AMS27_13265 [Bacteroides sp. SM23_62_1]|nr:MAG: hypothetical protein AMS27_13265 [Bacteroides sp. SM23_62_1]